MRAFLQQGDWFSTYKYLAQEVFGFHDYRKNGPASLNATLDNMIDLAMNDIYSGWRADLKAFDYKTDVAGSVKLVSALHPLSVALLRDDPEIYRRRALPMTEFLLSREKYLFSENETITGQNASHLMRGPAAEVSELAGLYLMSQNRSAVLRHEAEEVSKTPRRLNLNMMSSGDTFQDLLALYRMSGNVTSLDRAKAKADAYIAERVLHTQTDFHDVHVETGGQFWTDFAPKWRDLFELYEATSDKRYLDAAVAGAKEYTQYVWLQPTVPDHDVLINQGNSAPFNYTGKLPDPKPMPAPEQMVPAWRVSQIGLSPEASTTYISAPGIFLTNYAAYMLRLSEYTKDHFFRDIGRSAIVGRYENFPGYDILGAYTTVYQRPDYPLRPWEQLTYNQFYYNHIWPNIALLYDFLISDAITRSDGKIAFPSRYAPAYAYLQSKVYGDQRGEVYGDRAVQLWMPRGLLTVDQTELNYVSAYSGSSLYLIFMNQASAPLEARVRIDPNVANYNAGNTYPVRVWKDGVASAGAVLRDGTVDFGVSGGGMTVLAVDRLKILPKFQAQYLDPTVKPFSDQSYGKVQSRFGAVHGMMLSMGKPFTSAYVWLEATEKEITSAELHYEKNGAWEKVDDTQYPYEFSLPLSDTQGEFKFYVESVFSDGHRERSETLVIRR